MTYLHKKIEDFKIYSSKDFQLYIYKSEFHLNKFTENSTKNKNAI